MCLGVKEKPFFCIMNLQQNKTTKKGAKKLELSKNISNYLDKLQDSLFPFLRHHLEEPLSAKLMHLVTILDMIEIEKFVFDLRGFRGRPQQNRSAIARSFIAKSVYNIADTKLLIDRLKSDRNFRKVCGFDSAFSVPSESTFSRAFKEFAKFELPQKAHEKLIVSTYDNKLVGHVSYDSTAIPAREKPVKTIKIAKVRSTKRAAKGCAELTRIEKQFAGKMSLPEMIKDIPSVCNIGRKTSSAGHMFAWVGYKLHLSVDDHSVILAGILSSASVNDTQVAIPLTITTSKRVTNLYDLMDSGYQADAILNHSRSLGHVPIIKYAAKRETQKAIKTREEISKKVINWLPAEEIRYNIRSSVERSNSRLKEEFGALRVRVKGAVKVFAHIMYGILAQSADQILKLAT